MENSNVTEEFIPPRASTPNYSSRINTNNTENSIINDDFIPQRTSTPNVSSFSHGNINDLFSQSRQTIIPEPVWLSEHQNDMTIEPSNNESIPNPNIEQNSQHIPFKINTPSQTDPVFTTRNSETNTLSSQNKKDAATDAIDMKDSATQVYKLKSSKGSQTRKNIPWHKSTQIPESTTESASQTFNQNRHEGGTQTFKQIQRMETNENDVIHDHMLRLDNINSDSNVLVGTESSDNGLIIPGYEVNNGIRLRILIPRDHVDQENRESISVSNFGNNLMGHVNIISNRTVNLMRNIPRNSRILISTNDNSHILNLDQNQINNGIGFIEFIPNNMDNNRFQEVIDDLPTTSNDSRKMKRKTFIKKSREKNPLSRNSPSEIERFPSIDWINWFEKNKTKFQESKIKDLKGKKKLL